MNDVPLSFNATSSSSWTVSHACMHLSEKRFVILKIAIVDGMILTTGMLNNRIEYMCRVYV